MTEIGDLSPMRPNEAQPTNAQRAKRRPAPDAANKAPIAEVRRGTTESTIHDAQHLRRALATLICATTNA